MRITALLALMMAITDLSAQQGPTTGYAPINGLTMYYEVHGSGEPVVLVHGAFMTIAARLTATSDRAPPRDRPSYPTPPM
jgi:hypothetical protein